MTSSAIACAMGGGLIVIEAMLLKILQGKRTVWSELVFNLNSRHILMWVFRGVEIAAYAAVLTHLNLHWFDPLPHAAQWLIALFAWDLCFYWRHRAHHRFAWLGAVHVAHHQGENFNLSLCNRNSQHGLGSRPHWLLMFCTLAGTIALGAHCDGKRWGTFAWSVLTISIPALLLNDRAEIDIVPAWLMLCAFYGVFGIVQFFRTTARTACPQSR